MTSSRWRDLPLKVREVAVHEAGHAVIGELLGLPVRWLRIHRDGTGLCMFADERVAPWVEVAVNAAGHCCEVWFRGGKQPSVYGAYFDRRDGVKVMQRAGVAKYAGVFAVVEVEKWLGVVFENAEVSGAVRRVARALATAKRQHLGRWEFLRAADFDGYVGAETVGSVKRFCRMVVRDVHAKFLNLEG